MTMSELARRCPCHALVDDPSAAACPACARPLVPHHSTWSPLLKWWLVAELARTRFYPWLSEQAAYEVLLRDALNGVRAGAGPNPNGVGITMSTTAADLFPIALERAAAWKAAGSPIGRTSDLRNS